MPRFFVESPLAPGGSVIITGDDAHHIARALRMRPGETITLCGPEARPHEGVLQAFSHDAVSVRVGPPLAVTGEPTVEISLFIGLAKPDKMALVVQKTVELGVSRLIPFVAARTVAHLANGNAEKLSRLQKIAREAAMQCGRGKIPQIHPVLPFVQALALATTAATPLFCYEGGGTTPLARALSARPLTTVSALIGSEGGFAPEEAQQAAAAGLMPVSLGSRILRCETAPLCVLSAVLYAAGEL